MARTTGRSGFKMKSGNTPLRQDANDRKNRLGSEISRFFSNLDTDLQAGAQKHSDWKKRRAEDPKVIARKAKRKDDMAKKYGTGEYRASGSKSEKAYRAGESKFQYDKRMRHQDWKAKKAKSNLDKADLPDLRGKTDEDLGGEVDLTRKVVGPVETSSGGATYPDHYKYTTKDINNIFYQKHHTPKAKKSTEQGTTTWVAPTGAVTDEEYNTWTPHQVELHMLKNPDLYPGWTPNNPITKKSGFKMKSSPAKIFDKKGKRRKNYKY